MLSPLGLQPLGQPLVDEPLELSLEPSEASFQTAPDSALGVRAPVLLAKVSVLADERLQLIARELLTGVSLYASSLSAGPTLTSIFPMLSPRSRPRNASGAFSIPSITISR